MESASWIESAARAVAHSESVQTIHHPQIQLVHWLLFLLGIRFCWNEVCNCRWTYFNDKEIEYDFNVLVSPVLPT